MKKIGEGMERKFFVALALFLLSFNVAIVYAAPSPNNDFGDATGTRPNKRVLVAYDEEIASSSYHFFDAFSTISGASYIHKQIRRAISRFPWYLKILPYSYSWDSDDNLSSDTDCILEVEREIGWVKGETADILIAWTGQNNNNSWGGCAHVGYGSCIIKVQTDWADDNCLQEELTHIFGVMDHCQDDNCVMSRKWQWWSTINENLYPEGGTVIVLIFNWQYVGYISTNWCHYHETCLYNSGGNIASIGDAYTTDTGSSEISDEGIIISDPSCNPANPQPKEGINQPTIWTYLVRIAIVALPTMIFIVALKVIIKRRRKKEKTEPGVK